MEDFKERLENYDGIINALDEAVFKMNHIPLRGWIPRGYDILQQRPGIYAQCNSLLLRMQNNIDNLVVPWHLMEGSMTVIKFHNILCNFELDNDDMMLVLDNAIIHKVTSKLCNMGVSTITELAEEWGVTLNYLSMYMPVLNLVDVRTTTMP